MISTNPEHTPSMPKVEEIRAYCALILYRQGNSTCAASQHTVNNDQLGPGVPVSVDDALKTLAQASPKSKTKPNELALHDPGLLWQQDDSFVWHRPRAKRPMWFRLGKTVDKLEPEWPPLLMIWHRGNLTTYALGSNQRPTLDSPLYVAPLMNLSKGLLCQGSGRLKHKLTSADLSPADRLLDGSFFTHRGQDRELFSHAPANQSCYAHLCYWRELAKHTTRITPSMLVKTKLTLADAIKRIAQ